jgi:ribosomal-protein-alanine N-acetyltransferase
MQASLTDFVIRPTRADDAPALAELEARCAGAARWGTDGYQKLDSNGSNGWAAQRNDRILGFIVVRNVADEMEILNLAVDPDARRSGIGRRLLHRAMQDANRQRVLQAHLEVRESNATARAFYLSAGFAENGRRKDYYSQPVEDAILLTLRVD